MEKSIGLRFLLRDTTFCDVIIEESKAKEIIGNWRSNYYKIKDISCVGETNPPIGGWMWAVEVDSIRAIHTFVLQQQGVPPVVGGNRVSGVLINY